MLQRPAQALLRYVWQVELSLLHRFLRTLLDWALAWPQVLGQVDGKVLLYILFLLGVHLDEHAIELLHLLYAGIVHLFGIRAVFLASDLWFGLGCLNFVDSVRVYIIGEIRCVEVLQAVSHFLLLCEL